MMMTMTTKNPRIIVETVPNDHCRPYHANTRLLTEGHIESFHFPLRESSEKYLEKLGPVGSEIVRKLDQVTGIEEVSVSLYNLQVIIGNAFTWDDGIDEAVITALKDAFGEQGEEVDVVRKDVRHNYRDHGLDFDDDLELDDLMDLPGFQMSEVPPTSGGSEPTSSDANDSETSDA